MSVVVVALTQAAASTLHGGATSGSVEAESLLELAARFGASLRPQHAGVTDPALGRWFVLDGVEGGRAADAAAAFRGHPAVDAAYVKPSDELPA